MNVRQWATTAVRRTPFTATVITIIVVLGAVTGTFVTRVSDHPWGNEISYGLPSFQDGRWWTLITGMFFAVTPLCYLAVIGSFAVLVGITERRLGTARAVLACVYGHLVGILGAAFLLAVAPGGWTERWAHSVDVGFSAGAMAAGAIVSATFRPRWRRWSRLALCGYVLGAIVVLGQLADLVHLVAVLCALPLGRAFLRLGERGTEPGSADRARALLAEHGGGTLSWMTTWRGCDYLIAEDGYLAYRRHAGVAIALGEPVGSAAWRARAAGEFTAHCERSGLVPCWFSVGDEVVEQLRPRGWRGLQVAEDTLIELRGLQFRGKAWQDVRTARNRAAKEGIGHRMITLADATPALLAQVREVSAGWLRDKRMPELGFTLGGLAEAMDPRVRVGVAVDAAGTVHGVTSWLPVLDGSGRPRGWTLDMMRRRPGGFRLVIDFLIASACLEFQAEGAELVSLSGAPLARSADRDDRAPAMQRMLDRLGGILEPCYGFRSLHAFKAKFQPRRQPLHLVYRRTADLPRIGIAVLRAYLAGARQRKLAALRPIPVLPRLEQVAAARELAGGLTRACLL